MKFGLIRAKIYQEKDRFAEALMVSDGKILAVGTTEEILSLQPETIIDCQGQTLIPGFNDSHSHLMMIAEQRQQVQLLDSPSIAEVIKRGKAFLASHPDITGLQGMGWNPSEFIEGETRNLNRHDLDLISTDIPILFTRACGHMITANTKALTLAGITSNTPQVAGGLFEIEESGPNGRFYENARQLVEGLIPRLSQEDMQRFLADTMAYALSLGITTVQTNDIGLIRPPHETLDIYSRLYQSGAPTLKTHHQMCFDTPEDFEQFIQGAQTLTLPHKLTLGPLKLFKDGSLGGRSALMSQDYLDTPTRGLDVLPIAQTKPFLDIARQYHIPVIAHCIGDRAMSEMLDAYQPITREDRWGIVHCQMTTDEILQRMVEQGVIALMQPIFLRADVPAVQTAIPTALQETSYAWKTMINKCIPIAIGTDSPVEDLNPFMNIYTALKRRNPSGNLDSFRPEEALSVAEVIDGYTIGSAYAEFKETTKGRLLPSYDADIVLLDRDIFTIPAEDILETKVLKTFVNGEMVYEQSA